MQTRAYLRYEGDVIRRDDTMRQGRHGQRRAAMMNAADVFSKYSVMISSDKDAQLMRCRRRCVATPAATQRCFILMPRVFPSLFYARP